MPWAGRTHVPADKEDELDRYYGTEVMELAAHALRQFRARGSAGEPFIGVFEPTTYAATDLYQMERGGDVAWRRHIRAMKPVPDAQRTGPPIGGGRGASGPIGGARPGPLVEGQPVEPEIVGHRLIGPTAGQHGWTYTQVFAGSDGAIYGVAPDHRLFWYRHDAARGWSGPKPVGTGWAFRHVFSAGDGVIYAIDEKGRLLWYRHDAYLTGDGFQDPPAWDARSAMIVQTDWTDVRQVFAGGKGVIYVVTDDGRLLWYRHIRYLDPVRHPVAVPASRPAAIREGLRLQWLNSWEGPKEVGQGWRFSHVASSGAGHVYAVTPAGHLLWYRHLGYDSGGPLWWADANGREFVDLGAGWNDATAVVAGLDSTRGPRLR